MGTRGAFTSTHVSSGRAVALFDSSGYLTASRLGQIVALRADDTTMRVYVIKPNAAGEMKWQESVTPPSEIPPGIGESE